MELEMLYTYIVTMCTTKKYYLIVKKNMIEKKKISGDTYLFFFDLVGWDKMNPFVYCIRN